MYLNLGVRFGLKAIIINKLPPKRGDRWDGFAEFCPIGQRVSTLSAIVGRRALSLVFSTYPPGVKPGRHNCGQYAAPSVTPLGQDRGMAA
jgi:hypothetical protein